MDRGFGFIKTTEQEGDLFFQFKSLSEGQEVEFEKGQGRDGRPAAVKVRLTETQVEDAGSDSGDDDGNGEDDDGNGGDDVVNGGI